VAEVLEVAQLVDYNGVAEVQVGRRGVEAELDAERPLLAELFCELGLANQLVGTPTDGLNGLLDGGHLLICLPGVVC
jgi:hypothetical protein